MSDSRRERQVRLAGAMVAGPLSFVGAVLLFLDEDQDDLGLPLLVAAAVVNLTSIVVRAWLRPNRHAGQVRRPAGAIRCQCVDLRVM